MGTHRIFPREVMRKDSVTPQQPSIYILICATRVNNKKSSYATKKNPCTLKPATISNSDD